MNDYLIKILDHKKTLNETKAILFKTLKENMGNTDFTRYGLFKKKISSPGQVNLIAEIKKASPSRGLLRDDFDALEIAKAYVSKNVAAISILTEEKYFLGNMQYIKKVSSAFDVPVLMKDFIIDEGQIFEAQLNGASAILLIAAILEARQLREFIILAQSLDLDCLVEVHSQDELEKALDCGAEIIGINNRDLNTFDVDLSTAKGLIPSIPKDKVIVVESGISNHNEINELKEMGAQAVLIGETFMREKDIGKKIDELMQGQM